MKPAIAHTICRIKKLYADPKRSLAITADALKIMMRPMNTSTTVLPKIQRSTLTRLAIGGVRLDERLHHLLEDAAAVFIAVKLIEAGACRREQNHISWHCR